MDLILTRKQKNKRGIFGLLSHLNHLCVPFVTLEHAYPDNKGSYISKIPDGMYRCVKGSHSLHQGPPFTTFEITGVKGHAGILFHVGNTNEDSEGCVLLGELQVGSSIHKSKDAFSRFMSIQDDLDTFSLIVISHFPL